MLRDRVSIRSDGKQALPRLIEDELEEIRRLCRLYGVRKLKLFGSILRPDFDRLRSDVDLLVEFEQAVANSFANFIDFKDVLEDLCGRRVDLFELRAIRNRRLRHHIERSKLPVFPGVVILSKRRRMAASGKPIRPKRLQ